MNTYSQSSNIITNNLDIIHSIANPTLPQLVVGVALVSFFLFRFATN